MNNLCKKTIFTLLITHLIILEGRAQGLSDVVACKIDQGIPNTQIINLASNVSVASSALVEKELKKEVKQFFKDLERAIQQNPNSDYIPPKIKVEGLSNEQNKILNEIIQTNAKVIKKERLYSSNEISQQIYKTPELVSKKYNITEDQLTRNYKAQLGLIDPMGMGIFKVTTVVSVGAIIGVQISFTQPEKE